MTTEARERLSRGPRAHSIAWMLDDDWLTATVTCHAVEGADCRMVCPEGCESWNLAYHKHELVDAGRCLVVEWLDNQGIQESHVGSHAPIDGFIEATWDGDGYTWTYLADQPNGADAPTERKDS